eukprot:Nitzschia sp. Nitz4//scaffold100_size80364//39492//40787//NITZ4_005345-RA/size80364-processed-gene-0.34-mRNA-1//1//CDS//3329532097//3097//frame0
MEHAPCQMSKLGLVLVLILLSLIRTVVLSKEVWSSWEQAKQWNTLEHLGRLEDASTVGGESENLEFWEQQSELLQQAWNEWGAYMEKELPPLTESTMIHPHLMEQVQELWKAPTIEKEATLRRSFWEKLGPDRADGLEVFACRNFLTQPGIQSLRRHLQAVSQSGIPTRRPNGMNRFGVILGENAFDWKMTANGTSATQSFWIAGSILDSFTPGAVSSPALVEFRHWLVSQYIRPLGRVFFGEYIGKGNAHLDSAPDDAYSYSFTIQYTAEASSVAVVSPDGHVRQLDGRGDVELADHTDASVVTMNINLDLIPDNKDDNMGVQAGVPFQGSTLEFRYPCKTGTNRTNHNDTCRPNLSIEVEPGMALLHRGFFPHRALPIVEGHRLQLVIWLFGADGYVRTMPYEDPNETFQVEERWTHPHKFMSDPLMFH